MRERGSVSTELIVLLPVLLLLVLGGLEMGRAASLRMALGDGTWRAARFLSIADPYGDDRAVAIVQETVGRNALGGDPAGVMVQISDDGGRSFGHTVRVRAEAEFCPLVPFLSPGCVTLRAEHALMIEAWP